MKEAVKKARQLMLNKKLINSKQKQDHRPKLAHSVDSRETSALELKEFLEIESNIRGYSNGAKLNYNSHDRKFFQNEIVKSLVPDIPNHAYSKKLSRENVAGEGIVKNLYSSHEPKHFNKDSKRIFADPTSLSKSGLSGTDIEAAAILNKAHLYSSGANYKYLSMQKRNAQVKAGPHSPLVAHRKQETLTHKNQEISAEQTNSAKKWPTRKADLQNPKGQNQQ